MPRRDKGHGLVPAQRLGRTRRRQRHAASAAKADGAKTARTEEPSFLVAAVGASAGGLEAFTGLLRAIPGEVPLALILVQHLAHDQPSILPELLRKATALEVLLAQDGCPLQPRHVYVIPPDARMTVADGHLRVRRDSAPRQTEGTIDTLFRSVASSYRDHAIGVVLSGSAQDGSAGLREIKAAGGLTMVQQPEQAAVDGMPRAAIATGSVDTVLPVEEIGDQLVRLAGHPFFARSTTATVEAPPPADVSQMLQAFDLLRRASGIDFANYKLPTLKRRIEKRMALHHLSRLADYVALLKKEPAELERLQADLLIHVTSFFREPASFVALQERIFPRLLAQRDKESPLRIWVPGCSTGEEVYSLAMVVLELLSERAETIPLQIFGTDVSERAIERARAGVYPAGITADVSRERMRRFFGRFDGGYRINKEVRECCVFARQDVTRDPPFSRLDLIVCRNLLIYLNQAIQGKVLGVFHYALKPQGMLMLGGSETVGSRADLFTLVVKKFQLYVKKVSGEVYKAEAIPPLTTAGRLVKHRAQHQPGATPAWEAQNDANRLLLDRYAPPSVIVDGDLRIVRARGSTSPFFELPSGNVSVDALKMVRPDLRSALREVLDEARKRGRTASRNDLRFRVEGRARTVNLQAIPLGAAAERQFLVLFEEQPRTRAGAAGPKRKALPKSRPGAIATLERELADTRRQLQSIIDDLGAANEELQSANEEILSSNEEMQSTNEELDTAKEELQSTNEELTTVNDELRGRNEELSTVNSDLSNLLASVQIPIVMVSRDLRIRRMTPAAERVLNIIPSDIGRPIGHLKPNFVCPELESLIVETIDTMSIREREVAATDGRTFALQIRPYQTIDNRIDGAVVVLFDVSSLDAAAEALAVARATGETLITAIRDPVLLLDSDFKVQAANRAFLETFKLRPDEAAGRFVYDLADRGWDVPGLRRLLEEVLPERKDFEGFEIDHVFPRVGHKHLLLDARRIESGRRRQGVILLIIRPEGER
jgi:two-component system, chemotaxis family, CheB/CheR fusion protein